MDLGTANTIIIANEQIAVNEPSVVALDQHSDKLLAVGQKAKLMYEKTNNKIHVIRPLRDGVIRAAASSLPPSEWSLVFLPVLPRWNFVPCATQLSTQAAEMSI